MPSRWYIVRFFFFRLSIHLKSPAQAFSLSTEYSTYLFGSFMFHLCYRTLISAVIKSGEHVYSTIFLLHAWWLCSVRFSSSERGHRWVETFTGALTKRTHKFIFPDIITVSHLLGRCIFRHSLSVLWRQWVVELQRWHSFLFSLLMKFLMRDRANKASVWCFEVIKSFGKQELCTGTKEF
jgi:hypothetical protein